MLFEILSVDLHNALWLCVQLSISTVKIELTPRRSFAPSLFQQKCCSNCNGKPRPDKLGIAKPEVGANLFGMAREKIQIVKDGTTS